MQLDLFTHSGEVILENTVISAFSNHDLHAVKTAIAALRDKYPQQQCLNLYDMLLVQLEDFAEARGNQQLLECCQRLNELIQPIAYSLYGGEHARRWVAPLWRQLAELAAAQPFEPGSAAYHAAPLWLAAGDYGMARTATKTIPSWRKIPQPLAWMTEIELRVGSPEIYWPLLTELAWLAPQRLECLLEHAPATVNGFFNRFSKDFENNSDEDDLAWFPAWLLICAPEVHGFLRATPGGSTPPAQTFAYLRDLLQLEKTGQQPSLIALRGKLRGLAPEIFTIYMHSR